MRGVVLVLGVVLAGCPGQRPKADVLVERDWSKPREAGAGEGGASSFVDVPATSPAAAAIAWATSHSYLEACKSSPLSFCPDDPLPRDWAAVSTMRMKYGETFTASTAPLFTDVPPSHWAFRYIQKLAELKLTAGCGDGTTYCPTASLSRAQAATLLVRAKWGDGVTPGATAYFTDVPASHWAFRYVQQTYEAGMTTGCASGKFCPDDPITRLQWSVFIFKLQTL